MEHSKQAKNQKNICKYTACSPYPDQEVSFNYLNRPYPNFHIHDYWEILLVVDNSLSHIVNGKMCTMKSGDVCLLRPNDMHAYIFEKEMETKTLTFLIKNEYMLKISSVYGNALYDRLSSFDDILSNKLSPEFLRTIIPIILSMQSNMIDNETRLFQTKIIINRIISHFVFSYYSLKEQSPDWLNDFVMALNSPFISFENVDALAQKTPYSYSRLSRIFKKHTGRTIIEHITTSKLSFAKDELLYTDKTISEIAQELDYLSMSHFNRTFKKAFGVSPREYRKINK